MADTALVSIVVKALVLKAVTVSASIAVITQVLQVVKVTAVGGNLGAVGTVLETLEPVSGIPPNILHVPAQWIHLSPPEILNSLE